MPTLQTAEAGRDESHLLGLTLVSSPQECQGNIEGLVVSCLPNRRLEAHENRLNQPAWCYLLHIFPSEQEQGAAWTFTFFCCCNLQHTDCGTPTKASSHPDVSKNRCALSQGRKDPSVTFKSVFSLICFGLYDLS